LHYDGKFAKISSVEDNIYVLLTGFALLLGSFGGTAVILFLKKQLINPKTRWHFDWDGIVERLLLILVVLFSSQAETLVSISLILAIISTRSLYFLSHYNLPNFLQRHIRGVELQKQKIRLLMGIELIASPLFAFAVGGFITWLGGTF
jgi:hypothetical protein